MFTSNWSGHIITFTETALLHTSVLPGPCSLYENAILGHSGFSGRWHTCQKILHLRLLGFFPMQKNGICQKCCVISSVPCLGNLVPV